MADYQIDMIFYRNAGYVCMCIGAAALIAAVILFFVFDIRTIYMIRAGRCKRAVLPVTAQPAAGKQADPDTEFRIVRKIIVTDTDEIIPQR